MSDTIKRPSDCELGARCKHELLQRSCEMCWNEYEIATQDAVIETLRTQLAAAESHLLTLAEECEARRKERCVTVEYNCDGPVTLKDVHAAREAAMVAMDATDASGSLAFAAGIKDRKETGNAE